MVHNERTRQKALAAAARLAAEVCERLAAAGPGAAFPLPKAGGSPPSESVRRRFGIGTATAEEALRLARDHLTAAGATVWRGAGPRQVVYSAGPEMVSPRQVAESLAATAAEHEEADKGLAQAALIQYFAEGDRRRGHGRPTATLDITAAADALAAGVRNALEDGVGAVVLAPGAGCGGETAKAVQQRFGCGSQTALRVLWRAKARLSMAGLKSEGVASCPRQLVYTPSKDGSKLPKEPVPLPGLMPVIKRPRALEQRCMKEEAGALQRASPGTVKKLEGSQLQQAEQSHPDLPPAKRRVLPWKRELPVHNYAESREVAGHSLLGPRVRVKEQAAAGRQVLSQPAQQPRLLGQEVATHRAGTDAAAASCSGQRAEPAGKFDAGPLVPGGAPPPPPAPPCGAGDEAAGSPRPAAPEVRPPGGGACGSAAAPPRREGAREAGPPGEPAGPRGSLLGDDRVPGWSVRLVLLLGGGPTAARPLACASRATAWRVLRDAHQVSAEMQPRAQALAAVQSWHEEEETALEQAHSSAGVFAALVAPLDGQTGNGQQQMREVAVQTGRTSRRSRRLTAAGRGRPRGLSSLSASSKHRRRKALSQAKRNIERARVLRVNLLLSSLAGRATAFARRFLGLRSNSASIA